MKTLEEITKKLTTEIYNDFENLNSTKLFLLIFNQIPNKLEIYNLDIERVRQFIRENYKNQIVGDFFEQQYVKSRKLNLYSRHFFVFEKDIMIEIYGDALNIHYGLSAKDFVLEEQKKILKFQKRSKINREISLITISNNSLSTTSIEFKKPKLDVNKHFNDGFAELHQSILKNMRKNNEKGLYLFHGLPGTGKSTYIKYLIQRQNKKVIFVSPNLAQNLDKANFVDLLLKNKNSILVIEDAEDLIISRDNNSGSKLSFILNLTDGILGECLGIQIIATFNTEIDNIDKALLRKGRLTQIYEFNKLSRGKSQNIFKELQLENFPNKEMTLAEIYNFEKDNFAEKTLRPAIGFGY